MKKIVVVPGFSHTSLSTIRCLAKENIAVWLVGSKNKKGPAYFSNIPEKKVIYNTGSGFIDCLYNIGKGFSEKPALLLTEDMHVVQAADNIEVIQKYYRSILPPPTVVDTLMDKAKFSSLAIKNGYKIPKTKIIKSREELENIQHEFPFPFLLKPYLLHSKKINSDSELNNYISRFEEINFKSLIIQEWIPGGDDQLYFCFLFFDGEAKLQAKFSARKIRQFPQQYGTTSFCVSEDNQYLMNESIKIFKELKYRGFCSIEYKYDKKRKTYFIMEPTVGRFNQQVALTEASGVNFPLLMMNYLYGDSIEQRRQTNGKHWIYETNDFFSLMESRNIFEYFRSLKKANAKVLFSKLDPLPLFAEIYYIISNKLHKNIKTKIL